MLAERPNELEGRSEKEWQEMARAIQSEFAANLSHEIRTPLMIILGYSELMYDSRQSLRDRLRCIGKIRDSAHQIADLVHDFVDYSTIESETFQIEIKEWELLPVLRRVLDLLKTQAWKKGIEFNVHFLTPLPFQVEGDAIRLKQVLMAIVGNSIKFTEQGEITLEVSAQQVETRFELKVLVKDTGIGILDEDRDILFRPFSQVDPSASRKHSGMGLGLALSRILARKLGGDVKLVRSVPGKGSLFEVTVNLGLAEGTLWAENPNLETTQSELPLTSLHLVTRPLEKMRILVVEDSPDTQLLVKHFLEKAGASVESAENGLRALEILAENQFDLVFMDMQMPVLDGYCTVSRLKRQGFTTPIIALTAHAMKSDEKKCLEMGCAEYVSKPVDGKTLIAVASRYHSGLARSPGSVSQ